MKNDNNLYIEYILRIATAFIFAGHGVFALQTHPQWIHYLTTVGFSIEQARTIMPLIGALDIAVALHILAFPKEYVLIWAVVWTFATATIRPLAGEPIWAFIERGGNWATPLVLILVLRNKRKHTSKST